MRKFAIFTALLSFLAFGCKGESGKQPSTTEKSTKTEQKQPQTKKEAPSKPKIKGFCKHVASSRTPHTAIMFTRGCWGPKSTQMVTYYMAIYFAKEDSIPAAEETAIMLAKWNAEMGGGWDLGEYVFEECVPRTHKTKKGKKVTKTMCTYVYRLKKDETSI